MNKIGFFITIFLFCTILGLYVGYRSIPEVGDVNPMTGKDVNDPYGTLYFLGIVLFGTVTLLLLLKYYKGDLLFRFLEVYIIFVGSMMVWQFAIIDAIGQLLSSQEEYLIILMVVSALTVAVRFLRKTFTVKNLTLAIAIAGAGGALGSFMGLMPALLLVAALGTYDIIAVFKTKHMIKLADESRLREMPIMFETPSTGIKTGPRKGIKADKDVLGLGTGDIAIPLILFVAVLRTLNDWVPVIFTVAGSMCGLALVIYYVTDVKRAALPALPPIIGCGVLGLGLWAVLGMLF